MDPDVASAIAAIGDVVGPESLEASRAVYADAHEQPPYDGVQLRRDVAYGPHERHRLDVFTADDAQGRAVLLFVHGGGFVRGDKSTPGTPHNENVGLWAWRSGMVGVTMNYRLAPEHRFPAGAEDVAAAVAWLRANVGEHGGDPDRIVLAGSSAGATHIAGYAAMPALHPDGEPRHPRVGAALGRLRPADLRRRGGARPVLRRPRRAGRPASPLAGLVASGLPAMVAVAERRSRRCSIAQAAIAFTALDASAPARVPRPRATSPATTTSPRSSTSTRTTACSATRSPASCRRTRPARARCPPSGLVGSPLGSRRARSPRGRRPRRALPGVASSSGSCGPRRA